MRFFSGWLLLTLCACATSAERYDGALRLRLAGDDEAARDALWALYRDEPDTAWGRKANVLLFSPSWAGDLLRDAWLVTELAQTFASRSQRLAQAAAKQALLSLHAQERGCQEHRQEYCMELSQMPWDADPAGLYVYLLLPGSEYAGRATTENTQSRARLVPMLLGLQPPTTRDGYRVIAVAELDSDPDLDVWILDEAGVPVHAVDDLAP